MFSRILCEFFLHYWKPQVKSQSFSMHHLEKSHCISFKVVVIRLINTVALHRRRNNTRLSPPPFPPQPTVLNIYSTYILLKKERDYCLGDKTRHIIYNIARKHGVKCILTLDKITWS